MPGRQGLRLAFPALAGALAWLGLAGCSARPVHQEDRAAINLWKIAQAYELATDQRGRPPRNTDELKRFFKELGDKGDPDRILRSPRDGQRYVILFGGTFDVAAKTTILAYEKHGADGNRYVLTLTRDVKLLTNEEFANASFVNDHKPSPGE